jgi:hypothetical protein
MDGIASPGELGMVIRSGKNNRFWNKSKSNLYTSNYSSDAHFQHHFRAVRFPVGRFGAAPDCGAAVSPPTTKYHRLAGPYGRGRFIALPSTAPG